MKLKLKEVGTFILAVCVHGFWGEGSYIYTCTYPQLNLLQNNVLDNMENFEIIFKIPGLMDL